MPDLTERLRRAFAAWGMRSLGDDAADEIERLRTEVVDARTAGFASAQKQAANIARLYESELRRMAVDSWMFDPVRRGDFSPEAQAKSLELGEEGWRKGEAAMAAENIAGAIAAMEETTDV